MLLLGFWAVVALPGPATPSAQLLFGLAVVAAALVAVLAAAGLPAAPLLPATGPLAGGHRSHARGVPRLLDPDASGRPRPRAPAASPVVAPR